MPRRDYPYPQGFPEEESALAHFGVKFSGYSVGYGVPGSRLPRSYFQPTPPRNTRFGGGGAGRKQPGLTKSVVPRRLFTSRQAGFAVQTRQFWSWKRPELTKSVGRNRPGWGVGIRFLGGLAFKAQRLLYLSTPGSRVIKNKKRTRLGNGPRASMWSYMGTWLIKNSPFVETYSRTMSRATW